MQQHFLDSISNHCIHSEMKKKKNYLLKLSYSLATITKSKN